MKRMIARLCAAVAITGFMTAPLYAADELPIVFVHGDSDTAGLWIAQTWRFESNGYPADRLYAVDIPHPSARSDDGVAQENRSSTTDAAKAVASEVDAVLAKTGAKKVVLIANSRGCQTSRNYVKNFGGLDKVAKMILGGCVHEGVFVAPGYNEGSEYNGAGKFLKALNAPPILPKGIPVTIIRSDKFDLYSQPDARYIGMPGKPTGIKYDSQVLPGSDAHVIPGADHRETAYSPAAFAIEYKAVTGKDPETLKITPQDKAVLTGTISGFENDAPTNIPLSGAHLAIYKTDAKTGARDGGPVYEKTVGDDGVWGDFTAKPDQTYEFVVSAKGYPVTHIFRSPFPRSYDHVNLRLYPALKKGATINIMRPRGYIGPDDDATVDGAKMPGIPADDPVPHVWKVSVPLTGDKPATTTASFNGETIAAMADPKDAEAVNWIEFTY